MKLTAEMEADLAAGSDAIRRAAEEHYRSLVTPPMWARIQASMAWARKAGVAPGPLGTLLGLPVVEREDGP